MRTKTLISLAVIAALPCAATAENISGAMYTAPAHYDNNHPAPTTQANAPYGRANIDTADQEHIATTAYVKGAYNSAIAAVNQAAAYAIDETLQTIEQQGLYEKQDRLTTSGGDEISTTVVDYGDGFLGSIGSYAAANNLAQTESMIEYIKSMGPKIPTSAAVAVGLEEVGIGLNARIDTVQSSINNKRVEIYTTWNNDNAKTQVAFVNAPAQQ